MPIGNIGVTRRDSAVQAKNSGAQPKPRMPRLPMVRPIAGQWNRQAFGGIMLFDKRGARLNLWTARRPLSLLAATTLALLSCSTLASAQAVIEGGSTATVPGSQASPWNVGGDLEVGANGDGTLNIGSSGNVQSDKGIIAGSFGSNGTVTVSGSAANWTNGAFLSIGANGNGVLNIGNGGAVSSVGATIAEAAAATGQVTVDSASWTSTGTLNVGGRGNATLLVKNGGHVNSASGYLGANSTGTGSAVFTSGSSWTTGLLAVGYSGTGSLTIENGSTLTNTFNAEIASNANSNGIVTVTGAGSVWNNNGSLTVGVAGKGTLNILDGGVVNTSGVATVGNGSPQGTNNAYVNGSGAAWNIGGPLNVGGAGVGILTISNGGIVTVANGTGTAHVGGSSNSFGKITIGGEDATPGHDPAAAPGTLNVATIEVGDHGTGALLFNHTSSNYVFAPVITGVGYVGTEAGTTILTADSSTFSGIVNVYGGSLVVNGSLAGAFVEVMKGGVLGGSGIVGSLSALNNGIVAPGNSIGTLNVAGNVSFAPTSIYQVEVNAAGQSDKIVAGGTATITGGQVQVLASSGNYAPSTTYNILTAAGGITGAFDTVTSNLAFLAPSLTYDPNNIYLTLIRNQIAFPSVGVTPNQVATAGGVEALGGGSAVYNAVLNLSAPQARVAFDQLSGETHASIRGALIDDSRFPREAALNRLRAAAGGVAASNAAVAVLDGKGGYAAANPTTERFAIWGQGFGSWGHWDGDGNAARFGRSTGGFLVGADGTIFDSWRVGGFAGYGATRFDTNERRSSGSSNDYHVGLYGGTGWDRLSFRSGLAYTWHDLTTTRNVLFPGFANSLRSEYGAGTAQVFGELAYGINAGWTSFEPFANLAYVSLRSNGFREIGGAAALAGAAADNDATFTTLGLRGASSIMLGTIAATVRGSLGWRHAFGDVAPLATFAFAGGSSAFSISGVPIARNAAVGDVGLDFNLMPGAVLSISYGGQFGSDVIDQTVRANLSAKF